MGPSTNLSPIIDYRVSIIVSTFDAYSVCWEPFCHGLKKYWPDLPFPVYFITNFKDAPMGTSIKVGKDQGWAANLQTALAQIKSPYLLYTHEDYWIKTPVKTQNILDYVKILDEDKADAIRLFPVPRPKHPYPPDERLGVVDTYASYRTSLQMALWRKPIFESLIVPGENQWAFEIKGSVRSQVYANRFLCVKQREEGINYVFTAVQEGEWSPEARQYGAAEGLRIPFQQLPRKPLSHKIKDRARKIYHRMRKFLFKEPTLLDRVSE